MLLKDKFEDFIKTYPENEKDKIWLDHSKKIQNFWNTKIIDTINTAISENEIDEIVQILDRNGKGNSKDTEAIARVMIPQGAWRKLFMQFKENRALALAVDSVLQSELTQKAKAIDKLYKFNKDERNYLTGQSGNFICSLLAGWDPFNNISPVSLKDRSLLMEYLKIEISPEFSSKTVGEQIVESNEKIKAYFATKLQVMNARTISVFVYSTYLKSEWKMILTVPTPQGQIGVTVPQTQDDENEEIFKSGRESIEVQALLAKIGADMGMKIWVPKSDRKAVMKHWKPDSKELLDSLPLSFDETVIRTIENIDVLWFRNRTIMHAFEVEHTTSIYSGILRMADLVALLPNLQVNLHIVAPSERREKVLEEINRPVFALIEGGNLANFCTYLSYDSVTEIAKNPQLKHLNHTVLDEFVESALENFDE